MLPLIVYLCTCLVAGCADREGTPSRSETRRNVRLILASEFPVNLPVVGTTLTHMAERLEIASNGTLKLDINEPRELVPPLGSLDAVSEGKVDIAYSAAGYWLGKMPAAPLFSSVPFGPETAEYLAWLFQGNGMKLYQEMYDQADYQVKVLVCGMIPPETSGWFAKRIDTPDDLKGLKMRFYGLGGRVMERLGVAVTLLASSEIFQALERGVIDATEFSLPTIDQRLGFHDIVKFNYFPGWHQQATVVELLINQKTWKGLSPDQRMLIELSCQDGIVHSICEGEGTQFTALKKSVSEYGVSIEMWSPTMLELFRTNWVKVAEEECARDPFFKKVFDDLTDFRRNYDMWEKTAFLPRN